MSYREAAKKLAEMNDRRQALELNRVVKNLYRLFDGHPPARIESYIDCLFHSIQKAESKNDFSYTFISALFPSRASDREEVGNSGIHKEKSENYDA